MNAVVKPKLSMNGRAALWYATERGWRVFPVHSVVAGGVCSCPKGAGCGGNAGKHPRTLNGSMDATTDADTITGWWTRWPDAGVAVATGGRLCVIDVDPAKGGDDALVDCVRALGPLPSTPEVQTGGGGRHFYLAVPDGAVVKNSASVLGPGLDVRGEGGYVVAPPSAHRSGKAYGWELSSRPEEVAVATIPPAWLERITRRGLRVVSTVPGEAIGEGKRNETLFSVARGLRARGLGERAILAALLVDNDERCSPPIDPKEVEQIARSACSVQPGLSPEYQATRDAAKARREAASAKPAEGPEGEDTAPWRSKLSCTQSGAVRNTIGNLCAILRYDERYTGLRYDDMRLTPVLDGEPLTGAAMVRFRARVEAEWGLSAGREAMADAVLAVSQERRFHPVRDYLRGITWDGTPRLHAVVTEVLHAEDSRLNRVTVKAWFLSAVARVEQPGCKVDTAFVLVGDQGIRKSGFFRVLGGPWFSDSAIDITNKDAYLQMRDAWIYEWPEIEAITGQRHAGTIKAFVTSQIDAFRAPYAACVERWPRCCVIVGTTNQQHFLNDATGSRRFHTLDVPGPIDLELLAAWRDQLWAEALTCFRDGEGWWLNEEGEKAREEASEAHRVADTWEEAIAGWLKLWAPGPGELLTSKVVLSKACNVDVGQQHQGHSNRAGAAMRRLGYRTTTSKVDGRTVRHWELAVALPNDMEATP